MKIAILSDSVISASKIYQEISELGEIEADICLLNHKKCSFMWYCIRQLGGVILRVEPPARRKLLRAFLRGRLKVYQKGLRSPHTLRKLAGKQYDIGLHDASVIYTREMISCFARGILNAHIGLLPRYRGRCVMEWSLYEGAPTGVTVFYIDEGIDTGREIVVREEVPVLDCGSIAEAKAKLFGLAGVFYAKALRAELCGEPHLVNDGSGPRFYVMSQKRLAEVERLFTPSNEEKI